MLIPPEAPSEIPTPHIPTANSTQSSVRVGKVLLLYSLTGGSHLRVAETISKQLQAMHPDCETILYDGLKRARFSLTFDPTTAYAKLTIRLIWLFNLLYRLAETPPGARVLKIMIKWLWGKGIAEVIDREAPDLVVSTHPFFSPSTHCSTKRRPRWVTIVTDMGRPPRAWFGSEADALIVSTPEIADYARRQLRVPAEKIVTLDYEYPIDPRFQSSSSSPARSGCILVLGGGVGAGKIPEQVSILRQHFPRAKVIVICGHNDRLQAELARKKDEKMEVYGFVDRMDELMREADIVVSKAGPATIVEAAALRKPLIITGWVGLQERDNVRLVVSRNLGLSCPSSRDLPSTVRRIYRDYASFSRGDPVFSSGAAKIAQVLVQHAQQ